MPLDRILIIVINNNNYPNTNLTIMRHQRCTMNPPIPSLATTKLRHPLDTRGDASTSHHSVENVVALGAWVADSTQKRGLQYPRDLEGRGCEEDAEGRVGTDKEILDSLVGFKYDRNEEEMDTYIPINTNQRQTRAWLRRWRLMR